jgi:hypothetical protein
MQTASMEVQDDALDSLLSIVKRQKEIGANIAAELGISGFIQLGR